MHFMMGTGIYGEVKKVGPTPIITKFVMIQLLPIYPLQSIYATGPVETTLEGIPFIASTTSADVDGFPLARVDRASLVIAYCRALCAILLIVATFGALLITMLKPAGGLDHAAQRTMYGLAIAFVAAVTAGASSYLIPLTNRRDAAIRHHCGDILDACIDPAMVDPDHWHRIEHLANRGTAFQEPATDPESRLSLVRKLIAYRLEIAQGNEDASMEAPSDVLLTQLAQCEHDGSDGPAIRKHQSFKRAPGQTRSLKRSTG